MILPVTTVSTDAAMFDIDDTLIATDTGKIIQDVYDLYKSVQKKGYKMVIIMPSNMSDERKKMFKYYGATLIEVGEGDFDGAIALRDEMCKDKGWFNCNQFHNKLNIEAHYMTTGPEIYNQFKDANEIRECIPDVFVAGTGTGGTLMGVDRFLKEMWPRMSTVAVEPSESPVMSGGKPGLHGIQGIGDGSKFLVDLNMIDYMFL